MRALVPMPSFSKSRTFDSFERPAVRIKPVPSAETLVFNSGLVICGQRQRYGWQDMTVHATLVDQSVRGESNSAFNRSGKAYTSLEGRSGN